LAVSFGLTCVAPLKTPLSGYFAGDARDHEAATDGKQIR